MTDSVSLGPVFMKNLLAISNAQSIVDKTTLRLSTSKRVNSALDNPQNFFASEALSSRSSDLQRLLDGIGKNIQTIKEALAGVEAIEKLLNQADAIATASQELFNLGDVDPEIYEEIIDFSPTALSAQILDRNPEAYWRLNDAAGPAVNLGSIGAAVDGTYVNGVTLGQPALYSNGGDVSASFSGANQFVDIPDHNSINLQIQAERTIELVFNANTTAGRQVLYEEGATVNSLTIYIDNGSLYITGRDAGAWGPFNINAPVVAGQTYHMALVFDQPNGEFRGYLDGTEIGNGAVGPAFPAHSGDIGIGGMNESAWFHDGAVSGNGLYFNGRISDVALYNDVLSDNEIASHANALNTSTTTQYLHRQFENVMEQIDQLVSDATHRGIGLLIEQDLRTDFNELRSSYLITQGIDFTSAGLGIVRNDFNNGDDLEDVIESVRAALIDVRNYGSSLVNDLNIIETREDFIESFANTLEEGSSDLTIADMNEEGANLLAAQTRLSLAVTALSLANIFSASILDLFSGQ